MKRALAIVVAALVFSLSIPVAAPGIFLTVEHDSDVPWLGASNLEGIATDKWGFIYAVGTARDYVDIYDPDGTYLTSYGGTGSGNGQLSQPRDVDVDRWGNIYVLEEGNNRVTVFNPIGNFTRHISGPGVGADELFDPDGIAVNDYGHVIVSDSRTTIKAFFSWNGNWAGSFPAEGPVVGIDCDLDGDLWAVHDHDHSGSGLYGNTVGYYPGLSGVMTDSWGSTGTAPGQFDRPYDVDVDGAGLVYVTDAINHRCQTFESDGTLVDVFGSNGAGAGEFSFPYGIAAGPKRTVEVADTFNERISRWSLSPDVPTTERSVSGSNRYATAAAASQLGFTDDVLALVVATGMNWPDALGGAPLAGAVRGPLLLTAPDTLSPEAASEITRLNPSYVYVLGGECAVSAGVFDAIEALVGSGNVGRLGGSDRYETANLIAQQVTILAGSRYTGTAFVVTGMDFPDALAASPMAAANGWPIYLSRPDSLGSAKAAMQARGVTHGYIAGGTGAISAAVEADLNSTFLGFTRYSGSNRYETAAALAGAGISGMGLRSARPAIATGENFPDALAGGVLQGSDYSPLLLTPSDSLHPSVIAFMNARRDSIYELRFLGGTGAVSQAVRDDAMTRVH